MELVSGLVARLLRLGTEQVCLREAQRAVKFRDRDAAHTTGPRTDAEESRVLDEEPRCGRKPKVVANRFRRSGQTYSLEGLPVRFITTLQARVPAPATQNSNIVAGSGVVRGGTGGVGGGGAGPPGG